MRMTLDRAISALQTLRDRYQCGAYEVGIATSDCDQNDNEQVPEGVVEIRMIAYPDGGYVVIEGAGEFVARRQP